MAIRTRTGRVNIAVHMAVFGFDIKQLLLILTMYKLLLLSIMDNYQYWKIKVNIDVN